MDQINHGLHEECGVFGIYDHSGETDMASAVYYALYALQHRGQESCGIAINVDGVITGYRDLGLVNEVFTPQVMDNLPKGGKMAVGHVRYATSGQRVRANAQPMVVRHCKGTIALCHNGNLTNAPALRRQLEMNGAIFHGSSDTEVISYVITPWLPASVRGQAGRWLCVRQRELRAGCGGCKAHPRPAAR